MMAEVLGKAGGYCKGKGGSMHIADVAHGNLGATGIVGGNMPVAVGAALAQKLMGTEHVVLCFFGDGASNAGNFHESLNMASLWELPVIFVVENNLYGMSVPWAKASKVTDIADRACAYGMPGVTVDGMNVWKCAKRWPEAVDERVPAKDPTLMNARPTAIMATHIPTHVHTAPAKKKRNIKNATRSSDSRDMAAVGMLREEEFEKTENTARRNWMKRCITAKVPPNPIPTSLYRCICAFEDYPKDVEAEGEGA